MNYAYLHKGNKIPAVGLLQKLLNRTGESLDPDGIFGSNTKTTVKAFQRQRRLKDDGIVGEITWRRLTGAEVFPIIDCIDVFDPDLYSLERRDITRVGGRPIVVGGTCSGVDEAIFEIIRAAENVGNNVFLLRFHGHGAPGNAGVSDGHGVPGCVNPRSAITASNAATLMPVLRRLAPIFGDYGNIQLMHCNTGQGASGRSLLAQMAAGIRVPVTAAIQTQFGGGRTTFKFEGPTHTAFPGGDILRNWCQNQTGFYGMSPR